MAWPCRVASAAPGRVAPRTIPTLEDPGLRQIWYQSDPAMLSFHPVAFGDKILHADERPRNNHVLEIFSNEELIFFYARS